MASAASPLQPSPLKYRIAAPLHGCLATLMCCHHSPLLRSHRGRHLRCAMPWPPSTAIAPTDVPPPSPRSTPHHRHGRRSRRAVTASFITATPPLHRQDYDASDAATPPPAQAKLPPEPIARARRRASAGLPEPDARPSPVCQRQMPEPTPRLPELPPGQPLEPTTEPPQRSQGVNTASCRPTLLPVLQGCPSSKGARCPRVASPACALCKGV